METTRKAPINISVILMTCVMGIMVSATGVLADHVAVTLGINAETMGLSSTFYAVGMLLGSIIGGILAEKKGKRPVLFIGCLIMGAGMIVQAVCGPLLVLYMFCSFLGGFGFTPCEANGNALLSDNNPGKESMIINICQMFYAAVSILAPITAVYAVSHGASWQMVYGITAAMFIIMGIVFFFTKNIDNVRAAAAPEEERGTISMLTVLKSKAFLILCVMMFLMTCYESVAVIYGKLHLMDSGIIESTAALGVSLYQVGTTASRFICIFLSGKESKGIKVLTIFAPIGLLLVLFAPGAALKVIGMCLLGLGTGPVWPLLFVLALKIFPAHTGIAGSTIDMFVCAGYIVWPTLIGVLLQSAVSTLTVCLVVSAIVFVIALIVRDKNQAEPQAEAAE